MPQLNALNSSLQGVLGLVIQGFRQVFELQDWVFLNRRDNEQ